MEGGKKPQITSAYKLFLSLWLIPELGGREGDSRNPSTTGSWKAKRTELSLAAVHQKEGQCLESVQLR